MYEYKVVVVSVHDGDTIRADIDLGFNMWLRNEPIRLARINAPELSSTMPAGKASKLYLAGVIPPGTILTARTQKDKREKYGRVMADLFFENGDCVNDQMVQHNVAKYWDGNGQKPV
jgi:micrococcal nuclease